MPTPLLPWLRSTGGLHWDSWAQLPKEQRQISSPHCPQRHHRIFGSCPHPSTLEVTFLCRFDGKRMDGLTIAPWKNGCSLAWDATCPGPSHKPQLREAGTVASTAEQKKRVKYVPRPACHTRVCGSCCRDLRCSCPETRVFLGEVGQHVRVATGGLMSHTYLLQRVPVAV